MKNYETIVPNRLVLISSIEDLKLEKLDLSDVDECIIRMAGCRYGEPLCLMLLATKIRRLWERFPETKFGLSTSQSDFRGYADHIGFFGLWVLTEETLQEWRWAQLITRQ